MSYIGNKIFEARYISKSYGDKTILKDFYYNFSRFEKMGVIGKNGTGKSTFIKLLLGQEKPDAGSFSIGETVRFGYYRQEGIDFDTQKRVIDAVREIAEYVDLGGGGKMSASQLLQHFMFSPEQQYNYIYKLSGGERCRLYLCTILMTSPNFLILDEPTNNLDIVTLQVLEEYLQAFKGCVIIVSHDRYFMDKVADHLLVFQGEGKLKDFPGNYTQYKEWEDEQKKIAQQESNTKKLKDEPVHNKPVRSQVKQKLSFKERKELEQLTVEIEELEQEKKSMEDALCSGTLSVDEINSISKRLPSISQQIDEKTMRWIELSEIEEG